MSSQYQSCMREEKRSGNRQKRITKGEGLLKIGDRNIGGLKGKKTNKDIISCLNEQDMIVMIGSWATGDTYGTGECRSFAKIRKLLECLLGIRSVQQSTLDRKLKKRRLKSHQLC